MKTNVLALVISLWATFSLQAQTNERYIEVTGTSEIEIVPDKIHYLIEIREYFEEEFDGKSKPEEYRTKVPLSEIEQGLRDALTQAGISPNAVRTQEIGDYWRQQGQDFLVSKSFDITLTDFNQINEIVRRIDTKGIHTMRIGELENKDMPAYHQKGKIEALKAAQQKGRLPGRSIGQEIRQCHTHRRRKQQHGFSVCTKQCAFFRCGIIRQFPHHQEKLFMLVRFEIID